MYFSLCNFWCICFHVVTTVAMNIPLPHSAFACLVADISHLMKAHV